MNEPFERSEVLAHAIEEAGLWRAGYAQNWVVAVTKDGRVFDRIVERRLGRLLRGTFDKDTLAHIAKVARDVFPAAAMRDSAF